MTKTTLPDEILKSDALGRVRTPRARREALVEEFEKSGVSAKKFAALVGGELRDFCLLGAGAAQGARPASAGDGTGALVGGGGGRWRMRRCGAAGCSGVADRSAGREPGVGGLSSPVADGGGAGELNHPTHLRPMLSFAGGLKVFVALEPVDLRKSFSGLEGLVSERLGGGFARGGALCLY